MASYKLSNGAALDIEGILEFGIDTFGLDQALRYHNGLQAHLSELANFPLHYPAVEHIRKGYRMSVYGAHSIYYQIQDDYVLIVRIMGRQDISETFQA
ncbi:type II toxin-antitoxin system RelE/ParE family toxin [Endozoicomonas sp. 4G]|uniref:type II toxin-antitoxin system RelE/ParE family toxin n=1 Tax=Endozoicomonas sp. 4G TaxID=2872754 RepID=UPI002078E809|nr:type II toxin-antitoxin system RelE/ParE family toxin [Endozoicomonas sp. 4G]